MDLKDVEFGSVCSGIEAASVAWHPIGWRAAWLAEIDKFASAVLAHHHPNVPNLGDMTQIARAILTGEVKAPEVFCGGTPCQAFSVAGLRASLNDARGNLTLKFVEIANAIDHVRTGRGEDECVIVWENVPGVLSTKDNAFGCFLGGLAGEDGPLEPPGGKWANAGAVYGPRRAVAWRTLDAQYFGVAQRRRRVLVVASAREGFDPATVLFEWDGMRRDTAPSRQAGQAASRSLTASAGRRGGVSDPDRGQLIEAFGGGQNCQRTDVSTALSAHPGGSRLDFQTETFLVQPAHTLRGEGFDASEDGTGRGTPLVPVAYAPDVAGTLVARSSRGCGQTNSPGHQADQQLVAFDTTQITSATNRSNPRAGDPCHPLAAGAHPPAIAFDCKASGQAGFGVGEIASTMRAMGHAGSHQNGGGHQAVATGMQVRRLTPEECEALQGFPRGYTAIPWRTYQEAGRKGISYETLLAQRGMTLRGPSVEECPDGPRYKALGNSWAVPKFAWLGRRIDRALRPTS